MSQTVVGMFDNASEAQQAFEALVNAGISRERIDLSGNSSAGGLSSDSSYSSRERSHNDDNENGITRFFKNLFGDDDDDADKYSRVASNANSIVTVHATNQDEAEEAADILDEYGAVDVDEKASQYGYSGRSSDYNSTGSANTNSITGDFDSDTNTGSYAGGTTTGLSGAASISPDDVFKDDQNSDQLRDRHSDGEHRKINVIEENLEVGKKQLNTGGVRVRSRIVERPVEESIRLREERVNIERNSVDRPATDADFSNFEETEIEMVERSEVPVVNKQARVIEEITLNKEVDERSETINDTVRKTEVDVDHLENNDRREGI